MPEAILNLSNIKYKSNNIAQCLSMVFAKKIEQKYVVKVIQNNKKRLERNVFMLDRRKQRKISDTAIHLIKRLNDLSNDHDHGHDHGQGTVTVTLFTKCHGTERYGTKNSRSRAKNETFTVL